MKTKIIIILLFLSSCFSPGLKNESNISEVKSPRFIIKLPERIKLRDVSKSENSVRLSIYFNDEYNQYVVPMYSYLMAYYYSESEDMKGISKIVFEFYFSVDNSTTKFEVKSDQLDKFKSDIVSIPETFRLFQYLFHSMSNSDVRFANVYLKDIVPEKCGLKPFSGNFFDLILEYSKICDKYGTEFEKNPTVFYMHCLYELTLKPASRINSNHFLQILKSCDKFDIEKPF